MRRALLAALLVLMVGCDSSPTEPSRVETLSGTLPRAGSTVATVSMNDTGNLRIIGNEMKVVAADGTETRATSGMTVTMGNGSATECIASGTFGLVEGGVLSLGLNKGDYCIRLTEPTQVPEGASLRYALSLEIRD